MKNLKTFKIFMIISVIGIMIISFSCNTDCIYEKNKKVNVSAWNMSEIVKFDVSISDTISKNDFFINIRNSTEYSFSNIFFFITTTFPDGGTTRDTIECFLADINGKWLGKGLGKFKDNRILFKRNMSFPSKGIYSFEFEQAMRVENIKGIDEIGIRIVKSDIL